MINLCSIGTIILIILIILLIIPFSFLSDKNSYNKCSSNQIIKDDVCFDCSPNSKPNNEINECECIPGYIKNLQNDCVLKCEHGEIISDKCVCSLGYGIKNGICVKCENNQITNLETNNCVECPSNSIRVDNECVCISGYYKNNNECLKKCDNGTLYLGNCICSEGYGLKNGSCEKCERNEITDFSSNSCAPCRPNSTPRGNLCICNTGYYGSSNGCIRNCENGTLIDNECICSEGYGLKEGFCKICGNNQISDPVSNTCISCSTNSYKQGNECVCISGYLKSINGCVRNCNNGTIISGTCICSNGYGLKDGICQSCGNNEVTDPVTNTCISCGPNSFKQDNQCVCISGYYKSINGCVRSCDNGVFVSGTCICSDGYGLKDGICQICGNNEITDPVTNTCITCGNKSFKQNNQCVCDDGYYKSRLGCVKNCDNGTIINGNCICYLGFGMKDGSCQPCESNQITDPSTNSCITCRPNSKPSGNRCLCDAGYYGTSSGCIKDCKNGTLVSGNCICYTGFGIKNGSCERCENNQITNFSTNSCITCGNNANVLNNECICPVNYYKDGNDCLPYSTFDNMKLAYGEINLFNNIPRIDLKYKKPNNFEKADPYLPIINIIIEGGSNVKYYLEYDYETYKKINELNLISYIQFDCVRNTDIIIRMINIVTTQVTTIVRNVFVNEKTRIYLKILDTSNNFFNAKLPTNFDKFIIKSDYNNWYAAVEGIYDSLNNLPKLGFDKIAFFNNLFGREIKNALRTNNITKTRKEGVRGFLIREFYLGGYHESNHDPESIMFDSDKEVNPDLSSRAYKIKFIRILNGKINVTYKFRFLLGKSDDINLIVGNTINITDKVLKEEPLDIILNDYLDKIFMFTTESRGVYITEIMLGLEKNDNINKNGLFWSIFRNNEFYNNWGAKQLETYHADELFQPKCCKLGFGWSALFTSIVLPDPNTGKRKVYRKDIYHEITTKYPILHIDLFNTEYCFDNREVLRDMETDDYRCRRCEGSLTKGAENPISYVCGCDGEYDGVNCKKDGVGKLFLPYRNAIGDGIKFLTNEEMEKYSGGVIDGENCRIIDGRIEGKCMVTSKNPPPDNCPYGCDVLIEGDFKDSNCKYSITTKVKGTSCAYTPRRIRDSCIISSTGILTGPSCNKILNREIVAQEMINKFVPSICKRNEYTNNYSRCYQCEKENSISIDVGQKCDSLAPCYCDLGYKYKNNECVRDWVYHIFGDVCKKYSHSYSKLNAFCNSDMDVSLEYQVLDDYYNKGTFKGTGLYPRGLMSFNGFGNFIKYKVIAFRSLENYTEEEYMSIIKWYIAARKLGIAIECINDYYTYYKNHHRNPKSYDPF